MTIDAARPSDAAPKLAFDPDALRDKYRAERDRRLRDDGNEQYREIKGRFAHLAFDPYVKPINRAALADEVGIVVVGSGFGGLHVNQLLKKEITQIEPAG